MAVRSLYPQAGFNAGKRAVLVQVLVINLDRDKDRLLHMEMQLAAAGLAFERFPAVRGDALAPNLVEFFAHDADLSVGEVGCYASHLAIMQKMTTGEIASPALILEDDLGVRADFAAVLDQLLKVLPKDWDFVRLSNQPRWAFKPVASLTGGAVLCRYSEVPGSTGASLVSRSGALKFLHGKSRRFPVDQDLRRPWVWGLDMFGVAPAPITPDVLPQSSISTMAPSTRDRLRRQSSGVRRARAAEWAARHRLRIEEFGATGWLSSLAVNALATALPKQRRIAFLTRFASRVGS